MRAELSPKDEVLTTRELGSILWGGRWILLAFILAGVVWGLLALPPGGLNIRSEIEIGILPVPIEQSIDDLDWWGVLQSATELPPSGPDNNYTMTVTRFPEKASIVLTSSGSLEAHTQVIDALQNGLRKGSSAFIDLVEQRLAILRTLEVSPAAAALVVQEAFDLELFLSVAKATPRDIFSFTTSSTPRGALGAYLRFVLITFTAGIAVTICLHLVGVLWRRRRGAAAR